MRNLFRKYSKTISLQAVKTSTIFDIEDNVQLKKIGLLADGHKIIDIKVSTCSVNGYIYFNAFIIYKRRIKRER